jgi:hypothetical protein
MNEPHATQQVQPLTAFEMANQLIATHGVDAPIFAAGQMVWQAIIGNSPGVQDMKQVMGVLFELMRTRTEQESIH